RTEGLVSCIWENSITLDVKGTRRRRQCSRSKQTCCLHFSTHRTQPGARLRAAAFSGSSLGYSYSARSLPLEMEQASKCSKLLPCTTVCIYATEVERGKKHHLKTASVMPSKVCNRRERSRSTSLSGIG